MVLPEEHGTKNGWSFCGVMVQWAQGRWFGCRIALEQELEGWPCGLQK